MWGGELSGGQVIAFKSASSEIEIEVLSFFLSLVTPLIAFRLLCVCVLIEFDLATESSLWCWSRKSFKRSEPSVLGVKGCLTLMFNLPQLWTTWLEQFKVLKWFLELNSVLCKIKTNFLLNLPTNLSGILLLPQHVNEEERELLILLK